MKTNTGSIGKNVGFSKTEGEVKQAITVKHTSNDEGNTFVDNFGRSYVYTKQGLIY